MQISMQITKRKSHLRVKEELIRHCADTHTSQGPQMSSFIVNRSSMTCASSSSSSSSSFRRSRVRVLALNQEQQNHQPLTKKKKGKKMMQVITRAREGEKMARDTIDLSKRKIGKGTAESVKVTFLGANGAKVVVDCPKDQYILDAALEHSLELPFTCRGGICGACVAKCTKGEIDQTDITDLAFTLDEDEQREGLVLLCMARPVSDCEIETQSDWGMRVGEWKGATGEILGREPTKLMDDDPNRIGL